MTKREAFISALKREPITGLVPHFELVFFLTMEALGKVHPFHRSFHQWDQMSFQEKKLHIKDIAETYVGYAKKYEHNAIVVIGAQGIPNEAYMEILKQIREISGNEYFLIDSSADPTMAIPSGENMMDVSIQMYENPQEIIKNTEYWATEFLKKAEMMAGKGLVDGYAMCSDYCFNTNPFYSRDMFAELVCPSLTKMIQAYHDLGCYVIKHTDGNIMPIIDMMIDCKPDALHSLDPQGGVDLKEVKRLYGDQVALCGNVNCGLLQTGTEDQVVADVMRSLTDGMEGNGYIFCTSNCAYTGLDLSRYELMNRLWQQNGVYKV